MATQAHVRRIALSFPGVEENKKRFAFEVLNKGKRKGFAWVWNERVEPKKPKVPNPGVLAVRVANLGQKDLLLAAEPDKFFTEPHYDGFPAVLVRLKAVTVGDLKVLLADAWGCQAPPVPVKSLTTRAQVSELRRHVSAPASRSALHPSSPGSARTGPAARPATHRTGAGTRRA
jgi:hypothetical protein